MYFDSFDSIRSAIFQLKWKRAVCLCSRLRSVDGKSNVDTCAKEVNREILAANQNRRGIESVFGYSFRFLWLSTVCIVSNGSFPDSQSHTVSRVCAETVVESFHFIGHTSFQNQRFIHRIAFLFLLNFYVSANQIQIRYKCKRQLVKFRNTFAIILIRTISFRTDFSCNFLD